MDEIVALIARTIACRPRLRILARLATAGEIAPTTLARELRLPIDALSAHLRRLTAAGLIQRRRSGTWAYCVAGSPAKTGTLPSRITLWLYKAVALPEHTDAVGESTPRRDHNLSEALQRQHATIFEAATAFTHVRRLQILRHLCRQKPATVEALTQHLHMSPSALSRHMAKLIRRGYVEVAPAPRVPTYRLTRQCKTPMHAKLFQLVRSEWESR